MGRRGRLRRGVVRFSRRGWATLAGVGRRRTDEELLEALFAAAERWDGPLGVVDYQRCRRPEDPGASTIGLRFGGWDKALHAAGLEPTGRRTPRKWKRAEAFIAVAGWASTTSDRRHVAYIEAAGVDEDLPLPEVVGRLFPEGWRKLVAEIDATDP
jgi:hypothetical protein